MIVKQKQIELLQRISTIESRLAQISGTTRQYATQTSRVCTRYQYVVANSVLLETRHLTFTFQSRKTTPKYHRLKTLFPSQLHYHKQYTKITRE